ncbi:MAG: hypothetical protein LUF85_02215 [Bacteroides sp.]|nr:hypothetical protein [Bacteroides sp.]
MDADMIKHLKPDPSSLEKALEMQKKKYESLSLPEFLEFEQRNIKAVLDLFNEDKDNQWIVDREIMPNPYIHIYDIPLVYQTENMDKEKVYKTEKIVFYPSLLATGSFRIEYSLLKMYGNFLHSLMQMKSSLTVAEIIKSSLPVNKNVDNISLQNKLITAIRNLLSDQFLILK